MYITDIRQGKKNRNRYNVYNDDGFAFSVYAETVVSFGMSAGTEISDEQRMRILDADEKKYAVDTALKFLSLRMRSVREVRDRLAKADISEGSIDYTVGRLSELGYLDDRQYAAAYAAELAEKYGAGMIRQKLTQRGISRDIADEVLASTDTSRSLDDWTERLARRYGGDDPRKARQKIIRALVSKGFAYDEVKGAAERAVRIAGED